MLDKLGQDGFEGIQQLAGVTTAVPGSPIGVCVADRINTAADALPVAAQYADTWNTYGGWDLSPQQNLQVFRQQSGQLDEYCAQIGRDPKEIRHSFLVGITGDTPFASLQAFHDFIGRYREIGFSEFIFYYDYPAIPSDRSMNREMLERIANEAIPVIKSISQG